jgi:hypothetical protein
MIDHGIIEPDAGGESWQRTHHMMGINGIELERTDFWRTGRRIQLAS